MKKQIPSSPSQPGTHYERFMDLTKKVLTASNKDYREAVEAEKQEKTKNKPERA